MRRFSRHNFLRAVRRRPVRGLTVVCLLVLAAGRLFAWTERDYELYNYRQFRKLPAANQRIDMRHIDYPLLNAAIFYETNAQRALNNRKPFRHSPLLEKAAADHSADMARLHFLGHQSPVAGKELPVDRIQLAGLTLTDGVVGENVGDLFGIDHEDGKKVFSPLPGKPGFRHRSGGPPIPNRTYAGLAKAAVDSWMHSSGHRKNILNGEYTFLGAGTAHFQLPDMYNIDCFMATQNFSSDITGNEIRPGAKE